MKNAGEEPGMKAPYSSTFTFCHIWLETSVDNKACLLQSFLRCGSSWKMREFDAELVLARCLVCQSKHQRDFGQFIINTMSVWFQSNNNPKGKKYTTYLTQTTAFYPLTRHLCSMFQWKKLSRKYFFFYVMFHRLCFFCKTY